MGRDSQIDRPDIFGIHAESNHPLVVGIHIELVVVGCERPVGKGGLDLFHLHVGPLDDAYFNGAAARGNPFFGPVGEGALDIKGIGQVGLQDNPGRGTGEFGLAEGP